MKDLSTDITLNLPDLNDASLFEPVSPEEKNCL